MPHLGNDAIVASAQLINALQTIVSRTINPADPAVVSITQIHAGNTWNAIPESVVVKRPLSDALAARSKQPLPIKSLNWFNSILWGF